MKAHRRGPSCTSKSSTTDLVIRVREAMVAVKSTTIAFRAREAATYAHNEPATRDRAARIFNVPHAAVMAAWDPNVRRLRVG